MLLGALLATACGLAGCGKKNAGGGGPPPGDLAVQVLVAEARRQPVTEALSLVGSLVPNELVELKSEMDGTVEEITFQEGQTVKKGALLFRLDETRFLTALAEAEASFKLSQANLERIKLLRQTGSATQQEHDQAVAAFEMSNASVQLRKRDLRDARIYAPFDGVMGARLISPGQVVGKNAVLGSIVSVDPVKVEFNVPERFVGQTRGGQTIEITVAAWPDRRFRGEVFFIAPKLDADTRTVLVKALLPNADQALKPGMFASLDLTLKVRDQAVVIPESAVMLKENRTSVFVVGTDGKAQLRDVKLGLRMPGFVEVTAGLTGGETVITEGTQKVQPEGKVKPRGAS
jgi:membrane fusion protein (multidrug efflux system)